jgi:hypothetical protein
MNNPASEPRRGTPQLNCANPERQKIGGKRGMRAKMDRNLLDALWDEVIAHRAATFRWTSPKEMK